MGMGKPHQVGKKMNENTEPLFLLPVKFRALLPSQ